MKARIPNGNNFIKRQAKEKDKFTHTPRLVGFPRCEFCNSPVKSNQSFSLTFTAEGPQTLVRLIRVLCRNCVDTYLDSV